ncbi:NAD(P)/FAD-dependent oxidoreductase [Anatilimnocola floriformis]|uniref:NAD(P)/FAD-dependent oxidoreductase n=1 Tax=Anatilimnocola floriformis TaxID=2948575 RepID=UPI0020C1F192|nr:FAD-dependent oxidoreductase [Anatilimnocola floriformis]
MKLRSGRPYWLDVVHIDASEPTYPPLAGDALCEVVVLGGGITGALVAWQLVKRGIDVLLIDQRDFGQGSTAASTGLLQYEVDTPLVDLIRQVGREHAVHAYRRGLRAIDEIEQLTVELGDPCGFTRQESLYFASSVFHYRQLKREFDCRREFGFEVDWLSRQQLRDVSSLRSSGAIRSYGDGQIDPYQFTRRLIRNATAQGCRAHSGTKVLDVKEFASEVRVHTESGVITADKVVFATGYATRPFLEGEEAGSLHSTYALVSEPESDFPGWPKQSLIWETARPYFYARQTADGRAIIGGEDTSFSTDHRRDSLVERKIKKLERRFHRLFPEARFAVAYAWGGTFAETKDGLAYIGSPTDRPRAYFALGYGGNGITYSVIAAQLIADMHTGIPNPDAEVFRFGR